MDILPKILPTQESEMVCLFSGVITHRKNVECPSPAEKNKNDIGVTKEEEKDEDDLPGGPDIHSA